MTFFKEFKQFAMRGNVVDMAIGVVIGGAFGKIVSSLVADVIMPPLGMALGRVNFAELAITLHPATEEAAAVVISYGKFIQACVDFTIIAFAIFLMIKLINSMKKKEEAAPAAPPAPTNEEVLLTEIRDILKQK
ncbi:MAG: large-conductance mechanosensitive channel protein MscL [Kiritimatiellales bacterium]